MHAIEIVEAMSHDKKATARGKKFILPYDVGDIRNIVVKDDCLIQQAVETVIDS